MDNFLINLSISGVVHKRDGDNFKIITTFDDGFTINLECEREKVQEEIKEVLKGLRHYFSGEQNEERKQNERRDSHDSEE